MMCAIDSIVEETIEDIGRDYVISEFSEPVIQFIKDMFTHKELYIIYNANHSLYGSSEEITKRLLDSNFKETIVSELQNIFDEESPYRLCNLQAKKSEIGQLLTTIEITREEVEEYEQECEELRNLELEVQDFEDNNRE